MVQSETYTDPIIYEEGFFKNEDEETAFLNELKKRFEMVLIENQAIKKGTIGNKIQKVSIKKLD